MGQIREFHRADIVAEVHKRGTTLAGLARKNGLSDSALRNALSYPRTPSNRIIASFIGKSLHDLWPTWFDQSGALVIETSSGRRGRRSSQKRGAELNLTRRRA